MHFLNDSRKHHMREIIPMPSGGGMATSKYSSVLFETEDSMWLGLAADSIPDYWMWMHDRDGEQPSPRLYRSSLLTTRLGLCFPYSSALFLRRQLLTWCITTSSWPGPPKMTMTKMMMAPWTWAVLIGRLECQAFTVEAGGLCGESVCRAGGVLWSRLRTWIK